MKRRGGKLYRFESGSWVEDTSGLQRPSMSEPPPQKPPGPDLIYLNIGLINANTETDTLLAPPKIAQFTETRSVPILDDATGWDYSIVRFNMEGVGALLPLWIPQIEVGQADPFRTVYKVAIVEIAGPTNQPAPSTCQFATCFPSLPPPPAPLVKQDVTSLPYYAKSYAQFCNMVNVALVANYNARVTAGAPVPSDCPSLTYGSGSHLFQWNLNADFYPSGPLPTPAGPLFQVQVNAPLAALLSGFNWAYNALPQNPRYYTLKTDAVFQVLPIPQVFPFWGGAPLVQDFPSTDNGIWAPIDGFSFITNFVPVNPEQGTAPTQVGTSNLGTQGASTQYGFANLLTDYNVTGFPEDTLNSIEYTPQVYRMANLSGHGSIQAVDVQVFWRYRLTGELINLYLPNNSSMSLKLMFRRKGVGGD